MTRLTRAEAQARTREQLLATATDMFLRDGYVGTSIDRVAEEAGYTKGAVYGHFRTKDELCAAVLDKVRAERVAEIATLLQQADGFSQQLEKFGQWAEQLIGDPAWTRLEMEFAIQASRDDDMRNGLAERAQQLVGLVAMLVQAGASQEGIDLPLPPDEIATMLLCLGIGLGLFRTVEPRVPVSALVDLLRMFAEQSR